MLAAADRARQAADEAWQVLADPAARVAYDEAIGFRRPGEGLAPPSPEPSEPDISLGPDGPRRTRRRSVSRTRNRRRRGGGAGRRGTVLPGLPGRRGPGRLLLACDGRFTAAHAQMCQLHLDAHDHLTTTIAELDALIAPAAAPSGCIIARLVTIPGPGGAPPR